MWNAKKVERLSLGYPVSRVAVQKNHIPIRDSKPVVEKTQDKQRNRDGLQQ
jgi:hypothetical protein